MLLVIQSNTNQHKASQERSKLTRSNSKNSLWSCWNL